MGDSGSPDRQMQNYCEELEALVHEVEAIALFPTGERYRHEKRGTTYDIYGVGHANSAYVVDVQIPGVHRGNQTVLRDRKVLFDRDEVVIYRDVQSGALSVRGKAEFLDGRFTLLPMPPGGRLYDPGKALVEQPASAAASPVTNGQPPRSQSVETGTQRVKYTGHDVKLRGQEGSVVSWVRGEVLVDWDDKEVMKDLQQINAFNVTEVNDDVE